MPTKQKVLVTGGAGYIGAHTVYALLEHNYIPIVVDDLSTGAQENLPDDITFYHGSAGDVTLLDQIFTEHKITAVMHFAGSIIVSESIKKPALYYQNNTVNSLTLIQACIAYNIKAFIFSSTAAVYGEPESIPIYETARLAPINPYGRSKLMTELMLQDLATGTELNYAQLRYFNVAGADPQGRCGQSAPFATHLIKLASEAATGHRSKLEIYGTDYPTPDGTCIRDYIHVSDLAEIHVKALNFILFAKTNITANCGYGYGFSVREVITAVERVAGKKLNIIEAPRRAGDPAQLIAANDRIFNLLEWAPKHQNLDFIVESALNWEMKRKY